MPTTPLSFKREFLDTGIITSAKFWCFGKEPVVSPLQVKYAAGGNKFSCTAAYAFTSGKNEKFPNFKVVFCSKLHSKVFRRDPNNLSRWYIWQPIGGSGCLVLSDEDAQEAYEFDIYKFFKTSDFKKGQSTIKRYMEKGIAEAKRLYKEVGKEGANEYATFIESLEEAKELVDDVPSFEDKSYKLIDFDKFLKEIKAGGYGEELRKRASTYTKFNADIGNRFLDRVRKNDLKAAERARKEKDREIFK